MRAILRYPIYRPSACMQNAQASPRLSAGNATWKNGSVCLASRDSSPPFLPLIPRCSPPKKREAKNFEERRARCEMRARQESQAVWRAFVHPYCIQYRQFSHLARCRRTSFFVPGWKVDNDRWHAIDGCNRNTVGFAINIILSMTTFLR